MKTAIRTALAAALAPALLLAACDRAPKAPKADVRRVWIRLPAVPGGEAAGYFEARANRPDEALLAVSIPGARVEMHESMTTNHMASMHPIDSAAFADRGLSFAPGGKHLMIFGLDPKRRPGETLPVSFRFRSAPPITVEAKLVAAGQRPPGDGD